MPLLKAASTLFTIFAMLAWQLCAPVVSPAYAVDLDPAPTVNVLEIQYHGVWELVDRNTLHEERRADLKAWEHKFDGQLNSPADTEKAITEMLSAFGDDFTYFRNTAATKAYQLQQEQHGVVKSRLLAGNTAYISLTTFASSHTAEEMRETLMRLDSADAYILDLRDNRGGNIYQAFEVAAMFVDKGPFATLHGRQNGVAYREHLLIAPTRLQTFLNRVLCSSARTPNLTGAKPLVVLVNHNTRSAAEMVAGALRDNGRCLIIGEKTFGKGVVQKTFDLHNGTSLKVAMAWNYLPSGQNIHGKGLRPDVLLSDSRGDADLQRCREVIGASGP